MINGIQAELLSVYERKEGPGVEVTFLAPEMSAFYAGEYLIVQAFAVELAKAQSEECSRHPEPAAAPQTSADPGQGIDIPETVKSSGIQTARPFDIPVKVKKAHQTSNGGVEILLQAAPETWVAKGEYVLRWGGRYPPNDTPKTAIPEPVPPRTFEGDSDPSHNGTQMRERIAEALWNFYKPVEGELVYENWSDLPDEYRGHCRALADAALVPLRTITLEMQRAYFDVIDKNQQRVQTDAKFGRHESNKEAWAAAIDAASK